MKNVVFLIILIQIDIKLKLIIRQFAFIFFSELLDFVNAFPKNNFLFL